MSSPQDDSTAVESPTENDARRWSPGEPSPAFEAGVAAGIEAFAEYFRNEDADMSPVLVSAAELSQYAEWATSDALRGAPKGSPTRALIAQLNVKELVEVACIGRYGMVFLDPPTRDLAIRFRAEARRNAAVFVRPVVNHLLARLSDG